jgi:hypothetical protein
MKCPSMMSIAISLAISIAQPAVEAADAALSPEQVLKRSRETYAALSSYSDSGSITNSYRSGSAPASIDTFTFHTLYHAPRQFLLDFRKGAAATDERFVLWSEGQDFNTWWSATKVHEDYPQGQGANAFALGAFPTQGAVVMVPPLLFAKAGLQGPLANFTLKHGDGTEKIGAHVCYRLVGEEAVAYKTGNVAGGRAVTIWIDTESMLVRKVFEDTPAGSGSDTALTVTTSIDPSANAAIDSSRFHFEMPKN